MNQARIKLLEQYVQEDPQDPFMHYALALEWLTHDHAKALELFHTILNQFPDYLPVYYQAGHLMIQTGDQATAQGVLEKGWLLAKAQGETKAANEIHSLIDELD